MPLSNHARLTLIATAQSLSLETLLSRLCKASAEYRETSARYRETKRLADYAAADLIRAELDEIDERTTLLADERRRRSDHLRARAGNLAIAMEAAQ